MDLGLINKILIFEKEIYEIKSLCNQNCNVNDSINLLNDTINYYNNKKKIDFEIDPDIEISDIDSDYEFDSNLIQQQQFSDKFANIYNKFQLDYKN